MPGISAVHVDAWRAAYRNTVPDDYLANLSYEESGRRWLDRLTTDGSGVFVAEGHQGIFGFASGRPRQEFSAGLEEYGGEFETTFVLPDGQGTGAGRTLLAAVAQYLVGRGITSRLLWVFEENRPARRFYKSLGGPFWRRTASSSGEPGSGRSPTAGRSSGRCFRARPLLHRRPDSLSARARCWGRPARPTG